MPSQMLISCPLHVSIALGMREAQCLALAFSAVTRSHCAGGTPFRQLLRAVKPATANACEDGSVPLPALAKALGVDIEAASFPIFQTAVALYDNDRESTALMQLAANAFGVRAIGLPSCLCISTHHVFVNMMHQRTRGMLLVTKRDADPLTIPSCLGPCLKFGCLTDGGLHRRVPSALLWTSRWM